MWSQTPHRWEVTTLNCSAVNLGVAEFVPDDSWLRVLPVFAFDVLLHFIEIKGKYSFWHTAWGSRVPRMPEDGS